MNPLISRILIIITFLSFFHQTSAQEGALYLTNFQDVKTKKFQNWSITQDKKNNMLFANRKGIMVFNGEEWKLVPTPSMPFILHKEPATERIFVGCSGDYGYLKLDSKGFYSYTSLGKDTLTPGEFTHIEHVDSVLYFMSEKYIARFDPENLQHKKIWYARENYPFTGIVHNKDHVFINVWNKGLHRLQSDTLFPIVSGFYIENNEIIFSLPYNEERILIGTDDNRLRLFDGMKFYDYNIKENTYLTESIVSGAINLSDSTFAVSTLAGGAIIINKNENEIKHTINYQTDLPDDEVFALGLDNNNGLWMSHDKGLSRVDLGLPVRSFSTFPGIEGNINNVIEKDSTVYVATGSGVFYLTEEKEYEKKQITVKVHQPSKPEPKEEQEKEPEEKEEEKPKRFVKKFFNKIFKSEEEQKEEKEEQEKKDTPTKRATRTTYRTKDIYSLQSVSHKFKKIEGLEGKCEHLMLFGDTIIAGTNYGIYQIDDDNKAKVIKEGSYIYQLIPFTGEKSFLFASREGIMQATLEHNKWNIHKLVDKISEPVYSLSLNKTTNTLWAGGDNKAYKIKFNWDKKISSVDEYSLPTNYSERYFTRVINENTYIFSGSGIYAYDNTVDTFTLDRDLVKDSTLFTDIEYIFSQDNITWLNYMGDWIMLNKKDFWNDSLNGYLELFANIEKIYISNTGFLYVIENSNIYRVNINRGIPEARDFNVFYTQIKKDQKFYFSISDFKIDNENTTVEFRMAAPHYLKEGATQYQYIIEGLMEDWSEWTEDPEVKFFTRKGTYAIKARAKNIWGQTSETQKIQFEVPPPFTDSALFYILISLAVLILGYVIIKLRERKLKHDKEVLEQKVRERTATIEEQKEEITTQRDEILEKKNEIEKKNEEITDSIEYASRIQNALLPLTEHFHKAFEDHFILYKPRDIVSGDFYWIYRKNNKTYITAADCTGHGVPGAFMSMLGISFLNEIVSHDRNGVFNAADILNNLREMVKDSLHQDTEQSSSKDGMDMSLCIIDKKKNTIDFAGAFNPMILFKNGEMEVIKADRMPVGVYIKENETFTNQQIKINPGDTFYVFSDGYIDQFGGPKVKKYKLKALKNLLADIHDRDMAEQLRILDHNFEEWKGNNMQIDDVILMGIKI